MNPLLQELEWRRCAKDEVYFLEAFWKVKHPELGRIPFKLRDAQRETLAKWNTERYSVALKARQIGFSTLAGAHAVWLAFFHPDRFIVMLSRGEREAISLLKKSKYGLKFLPEWMLQRGPQVVDNNQTTISFDNESQIQSLPSGSDPARGESVYLVIVDEWAFLPDPEDAWASIEPITDIGGRVVGISTAKGSGNFFHTLYVGAKAHTNQFCPIFYPWSAVDDRGDDWYQAKARSMPEWQLHQEYPRDDVECFIKSGNPVFDAENLTRFHEVRPPLAVGFLEGESGGNTATFVAADNGPLKVWAWPVKDGRSYVVGADVAEGLEHGDFSVAEVIDHKTGLVVAEWHGHVAPDLFGHDVLFYLGWFFGAALLGVESNNHGYATLAAVQNRQYPHIYMRTTYDERTMKHTSKLGWRTQVNTKPLAIDELVRALRGAEEVTLPNGAAHGELTTFVRDGNGKMHGSPWDDRTMALAIANQMRKHATNAVYGSARERMWSLDWWADDLDGNQKARMVVGAAGSRSR